MLFKLSSILIYSLVAFFLSLFIYPAYIKLLQKLKAGKQIRDDTVTGEEATIFKALHGHKVGTPTMGGGVLIIVLLIMIAFSFVIQSSGLTNNSLLSRQETYMPLFAFFSMGVLGLIDDYLNIKGTSSIKGMTAKIKFLWMFLFSGFITYRFSVKLGITYFNLRPFAGNVEFGFFSEIITFFLTVVIVNAINITDGLDGLVGGLMLIILGVLGVMTFVSQRYLATTIIGVILGALLAFLWFNINPAKVFMGDSGALGLGGLISALVYLLNINIGIVIPFIVLMILFWIEFGSSLFQILSKKIRKKKLFKMAPYHHYLEHIGMKEHTIVMKFRLIQGVLGVFVLLTLFYQMIG